MLASANKCTGYSDVATWSVIEPALGIIAGCIATLRPLFKNMGFSGLKRSRKYNSSSNKKQSHSGGSSTGAGGGGASRRLTRPSNGHHYNNRNMLRLDDEDDGEELVVVDDHRLDEATDLELSPTTRTKKGLGTTATTTDAMGVPNSTLDMLGSESNFHNNSNSNSSERPCSSRFLNNNSSSSSSRIYENIDAFGDSRVQRWEIESLRPPPQSHDAKLAAAADGSISIQTTFGISSSSQHRGMTTSGTENASSGRSSSTPDLPLQGSSWTLSPPPPAAAVPTAPSTTRH